jgi:hypothetical protein
VSDSCEASVRAVELPSGKICDGVTGSAGGEDGGLVARWAGQAMTDPEPGLPGIGG